MGTRRDGRYNPRRKKRSLAALPSASEALLKKQRDVIAWWQLRDEGLTPDRIARIVDCGMLRPRPGRVFTATRGPMERDAQRWAAVLSGGREARLASHSVLGVAGIAENDQSGDIHIIVPGNAPRPTPGVVRHRTKKLPEHDLKLVGDSDFPGTTIARALVDAASDSKVELLSDYLDRAVMLGQYDAVAINRVLGERVVIRGRDRFSAATASLDASTGRFLSTFERRTTRLVATSTRIGLPVVNVLAHGFRPDLGWIDTAAIVECDGRDYHRSPAQILADAEREEILIALGYVILRLRWGQVVYEPERTLARIEEHVLANSRPPVPLVG